MISFSHFMKKAAGICSLMTAPGECSVTLPTGKNQAGGEADVKSLQKLYLRLNNSAIAELPADLVINTHVCRGNYHSTWATSGGYAPVAEILFGQENVNAYYLEFDDDRSGDFVPLQYVSPGQDRCTGTGHLQTAPSGKQSCH